MIKNFKESFRKNSLFALCLISLSSPAFATSGTILQSSDFVGISFWLISMALVASTAFFFLERDRVAGKWKTYFRAKSVKFYFSKLINMNVSY